MSHIRHTAPGNFLGHDTLALVLAGGSGSRLHGLVNDHAKPAVPFGGHYRIIDFTLSNCLNSGIRQMVLLTQYQSESLVRYVRGDGRGPAHPHAERLEIWPGRAHDPRRRYAGTADAVHQNRERIAALSPTYVLVLAGDHVYSMDYMPMIHEHALRGADVTVSCIEVPLAEAGGFGIVDVDREMRIRGFAEKPVRPRPRPGRGNAALASMGIYVFDTRFLLECLNEDAKDAVSRHDFGYSILPRAIAKAQVYAHTYGQDPAQSYWRDAGTIDSYWSAHMDLLGAAPRFPLGDPDWPLCGAVPSRQPARVAPAATVAGTLLGSGCEVEGDVARSVLSCGSRVGARSIVRECIVLPNSTIGRDCMLERVIVAGDCHIPDGTDIDRSLFAGDRAFYVSPGGITLVTAADLDEARGRPDAVRAISA